MPNIVEEVWQLSAIPLFLLVCALIYHLYNLLACSVLYRQELRLQLSSVFEPYIVSITKLFVIIVYHGIIFLQCFNVPFYVHTHDCAHLHVSHLVKPVIHTPIGVCLFSCLFVAVTHYTIIFCEVIFFFFSAVSSVSD